MMTVISEGIFDQEEFYKNSRKNKGKSVIWEGINLNTPATCEYLRAFTGGSILEDEFISFLNKDISYMNNSNFLFHITTVARYNLDFINYCKLIGIFSAANPSYKRSYQSARMFKNMVLGKGAGENFPIKIPEDLEAKLNIFNKFSNLSILTLLDILDISSQDLQNKKMTPRQFESIVYFLLKTSKKLFKRTTAHRLFESEICKRVLDSYKCSGYMKNAHQFHVMFKL